MTLRTTQERFKMMLSQVVHHQNLFTANDRRNALQQLSAINVEEATDEQLIEQAIKVYRDVYHHGHFGLFGRKGSSFLKHLGKFINEASYVYKLDAPSPEKKNPEPVNQPPVVVAPKTEPLKSRFVEMDEARKTLADELENDVKKTFGKSSELASRFSFCMNRIDCEEWQVTQTHIFRDIKKATQDTVLLQKIDKYLRIVNDPDYVACKNKTRLQMDEISHYEHRYHDYQRERPMTLLEQFQAQFARLFSRNRRPTPYAQPEPAPNGHKPNNLQL